ncbi:hypothetical protein B9Z65_7791 [Elsinoe australis]|uniref:Uncharacterized protein n=1 Tax=Elsinoe australis TaxID=40998 RepID=A0A2P8A0K8_9PEZI|nr:hypothetical protein B9Z65_7791 [Elsinoe australis]
MPFHSGTHGPEYPYAGRSELDENEEVTGLSSFYHLDDDDVFYLEQGDFPSVFDSKEDGKAFVQTIARIHGVEIYPLPSNHLRIATQPINPQYSIARPRLQRYGPEQRGTTRIANMFLDLVYAHEQMASHPHPNIVKYHGCIIKRGRIIGIVLDRHSISLDAMIFQNSERLTTLDPGSVGNGLESGIRHLQSLGTPTTTSARKRSS